MTTKVYVRRCIHTVRAVTLTSPCPVSISSASSSRANTLQSSTQRRRYAHCHYQNTKLPDKIVATRLRSLMCLCRLEDCLSMFWLHHTMWLPDV